MNIKTQEEILKELKESFDDYYSTKLQESNNNEEFITLEEFRDKWIEIIREIYRKKDFKK